MVYNVNHDGHHKARMVADGHLMLVPINSVYLGVVLLCGLHTLVFLAESNNFLETWSMDIGNAYLEDETKEKVYFIAGPEFGNLAGYTLLIIHKALYGLCSSGTC